MPDTAADKTAAAVAEIKHRHRQHVSVNFPAPGICVSRCADSQPSWPCGAYRAAAALEVALAQHRRSRLPADWPGADTLRGRHYCTGLCYSSVDQITIAREWPCQPYQDITRALLEDPS